MSDISQFGMGATPPTSKASEHVAQSAPEMVKAETVKAAQPRPTQTDSLDARMAQKSAEAQTPQETVEQANKVVEAFSTSVRFMVDEKDPKRVNVLMYDSRTGQVIRSLPTATLSQMLSKVESLMGVLFDFKA